MPLKEEDVTAIAHKMVEIITANPPPFWLKAEEHYNDHQRLKWFLKWWDHAAKAIGTVVIFTVCGAVLYIITFGRLKPW